MRRSQNADPVQGNLFDPPCQPQDCGSAQEAEQPLDPNALDDDAIIAGIPGANLAKAEALCEQVVSRDLADAAVPALEELWKRFRGYGINRPCREQLAVLKTLAKIETRPSRDAVKRIAEERGLSEALLPHALEAALACRVRFTRPRIEQWLEDGRPIVRRLAFSLAQWVVPPVWILQQGRNDPDLSVREAALITMGKLGHAEARQGLLALLARNPNGDVVRALATVADDEVITQFGRSADKHESLRPAIIEELRAMDDPRAKAVADRFVQR